MTVCLVLVGRVRGLTNYIPHRYLTTNLLFQEEILRYKKQYEDMLIERNKFKQQCTQVCFATSVSGIVSFLFLAPAEPSISLCIFSVCPKVVFKSLIEFTNSRSCHQLDNDRDTLTLLQINLINQSPGVANSLVLLSFLYVIKRGNDSCSIRKRHGQLNLVTA